MPVLTKIQTPTDTYERHYPKIVELANQQLEKQFWTASEMVVSLDKMQLLHQLPAEKVHAIKYVLNLFVRYELQVGDMWKRIAELFPRPEVKLACSVVEMVERAIHAEFYNEVNIQMGLDKEEHYLSFLSDAKLKERVDWLGSLMSPKAEDPILGVIIFSMTETALLFSSFAILKSFQSNGLNEIPVIARGANQSALDEDLHGKISAEIINQYYRELGTTLFEDKKRYDKIVEAIRYAEYHECRIIDGAIPSGFLNGNTAEEFKEFVRYRLNLYAERLGLPPVFVVKSDKVRSFMEDNTNAYKVPDFFTPGASMEYEHGGWDEDGFIRALEKKATIENGVLTYND